MPDDKPKRYFVVRHSYYVIHEMSADYFVGKDALDHVGFFYNESSHCADNEAADIGLHAMVGDGICATCTGHTAHPLGVFDTLEEAEQSHWKDPDNNNRATAYLPDAKRRIDELERDGVLDAEAVAEERARLKAIEDACSS